MSAAAGGGSRTVTRTRSPPLYACLDVLTRLLAPFIAEEVWPRVIRLDRYPVPRHTSSPGSGFGKLDPAELPHCHTWCRTRGWPGTRSRTNAVGEAAARGSRVGRRAARRSRPTRAATPARSGTPGTPARSSPRAPDGPPRSPDPRPTPRPAPTPAGTRPGGWTG